jgi:uncharacterized paraquat-inducible protein A
MIRVSLSYLVLIYLVLMLGPVFLAWLVNGWRRQQRENAIFRDVLRCAHCGFEFRDGTDEVLAHCPRCASRNERRRISRL